MAAFSESKRFTISGYIGAEYVLLCAELNLLWNVLPPSASRVCGRRRVKQSGPQKKLERSRSITFDEKVVLIVGVDSEGHPIDM